MGRILAGFEEGYEVLEGIERDYYAVFPSPDERKVGKHAFSVVFIGLAVCLVNLLRVAIKRPEQLLVCVRRMLYRIRDDELVLDKISL